MKTDGLTNREYQVATLVAQGLTDREVGERLGISWRTVDFHLRRITKAWKLNHGRNLRVQITHRIYRIAA